MARPLRYDAPGAIHHVTSRGVDFCDIVRSDRDRRAFVQILSDVVTERRWTLHSWSLMTNHLHLVPQTLVGNLGDGMRDLLGQFARRFNVSYGRVGHLLQHRYDAKPVESGPHLLEILRYIPLNPVRAGMVRTPGEWPWGSYRATVGLEPAPSWLEIDWTLSQFHRSDRVKAQRAFRKYVSQGRNVDYDPEIEARHGWILGSEEFCEKVQQWIDSESRSSEYPRRYRQINTPDLDTLIATVIEVLELSGDDLRQPLRGPGRKLIADLGHQICAVPYSEIANRLETTPSTAAKLRQRSRALEKADPHYAALKAHIRELLKS